MHSHKFALRGLAIAVVTALALGACDEGTEVIVTPPSPSISITPQQMTLAPGEQGQVSAVVRDAQNTGVSFASSNPNVATVSPQGVVSALAVGSTTITATAAADANLRASTQVNVVSDGPPPSPVAISVTPASATLEAGGSTTLFANVSGTDNLNANWESLDQTIATVSPASGQQTTVTAHAAGTVVIVARSAADPNVVATATITVNPRAQVTASIASITTPTGVSVNPDNIKGQIQVNTNVDVPSGFSGQVQLWARNADGEEILVQQQDISQAAIVDAEGDLDAAVLQTVQFTWNTARFDADFAANVADVIYPNGTWGMFIRVIGNNDEVRAETATMSLVLNNDDGFAARVVTPMTATNPSTGQLWHGGGTKEVKVLPVEYSGLMVERVTFGTCGFDMDGEIDLTDQWGVGTDATPADGFIRTINPGTEQRLGVCVISSVQAGLDGPTRVLNYDPDVYPNPPLFMYRWDGVAPSQTTAYRVVPADRQWFNELFQFPRDPGLGSALLTRDAVTAPLCTDGGVNAGAPNHIRYDFFWSEGASGERNPADTGADVEWTLTNTEIFHWFRCWDLLTNGMGTFRASADGATGVDTFDPEHAIESGPDDEMVWNFEDVAGGLAADFNEWVLSAIDEAEIVEGVSGTASGFEVDPFRVRITNRNGGTSCDVGSLASGVCSYVASGTNVSFDDTAEGYKTFDSFVRDRALNTSDVITVVVLYDVTAPAMGNLSTPSTMMRQGGEYTFNIDLSDNVDLHRGWFGFSYLEPVSMVTYRFLVPDQVFSTPFDGTLVKSFTAEHTRFVLSRVQLVDDMTGEITAVISDDATGAHYLVKDAADNRNFREADITGAWTGDAPADWQTTAIASWSVTETTNTVGGTLRASVVGPTETFTPPFDVVQFFQEQDVKIDETGVTESMWVAVSAPITSASLIGDTGTERSFRYQASANTEINATGPIVAAAWRTSGSLAGSALISSPEVPPAP